MHLSKEGNCFNSRNPVWVRNCPLTPLWWTSAIWNWSCFGEGGNMLNIPTQAFPAPASLAIWTVQEEQGNSWTTRWQKTPKDQTDNLSLQIWLCDRLWSWMTSPWKKQDFNTVSTTRVTLQWQAYGSCRTRKHFSLRLVSMWEKHSQSLKFDVVHAFGSLS